MDAVEVRIVQVEKYVITLDRAAAEKLESVLRAVNFTGEAEVLEVLYNELPMGDYDYETDESGIRLTKV